MLAGSGSHNGSIQAFLTRWLGKREKLSAPSPSLRSLSQSPSLSLSLICPVYFLQSGPGGSGELCLNPVPSYLAPARPTHSDTRAHESISPSLPDPSLNPCITQQGITIQQNGHTDSYCLFALFMSMYSLQQMAP